MFLYVLLMFMYIFYRAASLEEEEKQTPIPADDELTDPNIDGGWAWLVMVASFLLIFIVDGISFSFGVFLDVLIKEFGQDKSTTSLVRSVLSGVYLGAGKSFWGFRI